MSCVASVAEHFIVAQTEVNGVSEVMKWYAQARALSVLNATQYLTILQYPMDHALPEFA